MLDANLRGTEDVAGGMEGDANTVDLDWFTPFNRPNCRAGAKSRAQHAFSFARREVCLRAPPRVISVAMRNHRARNGLPWVDVEIPSLTVEAASGQPKQRHGEK